MSRPKIIIQKLDRQVVLALISVNLINWLGFVEGIYGIPSVVKYIFTLFVLGVFIYDRITNPNPEIKRDSPYIILIIFVLWSVFLFIDTALHFRSLFDLQLALGKRYFLLPYLIPLFIIYTIYDLDFFAYYTKITYKLIIIAILMQVFVLARGASYDIWVESSSQIGLFNLGGSFLLLTSHIVRKKRVTYVAVIFVFLNILLYAIWGRRGMLFDYILFFAFFIVIRLRSPLLGKESRGMIYLYIFLALCLLVFSFGYLSDTLYVFDRGFTWESFEASRGAVFREFFADFSVQRDWLFGRGLDGFVLRTLAKAGALDLVENGFLTIILRGGLFYLVPYLVIMAWSFFLGFFRTSNDLTKALAAIIFVHVFSMISFGLPDFSTHYIFIWIAVSACFSGDLRRIDNEKLSETMNHYFHT